MLNQRFLIAALTFGACAVPAMADIMSYSSLAALEAAVPADTFCNITFPQGDLGPSVTEMGVVFSASPSNLEGITGSNLTATFFQNWPSGSALYVITEGDRLTITLPAAVNAVSLYFGANDDNVKLSVDDSGGGSPDIFTSTPTAPPTLVSFATDSSFTTFTIQSTSGDGLVAIDDMQIGEMSQTPEAAPFLLVGTGLLMMGCFRRREKRGKRIQLPAAAVSTYQSELSRPICAG